MEDNKVEVLSTQYIVVNLAGSQYGIDIKDVDNIVRMQRITRVPKAPEYFTGVLNLRGEIVSIMSLRRKFHLEDDEYTSATRIIVVKPEQQEPFGIIVDSVKEVLTLENDQVDKLPSDSKEEMSKYVNAVGKTEDNLVSILNVSSLIEVQA